MMKVIFVQPFTVSAAIAKQATGNVVVLDVAFNAGSPTAQGTAEEQFAHTTQAFIDALDKHLAIWIDHHPHKNWAAYQDNARFLLVPREQAPACPPLITPEVVKAVGPID